MSRARSIDKASHEGAVKAVSGNKTKFSAVVHEATCTSQASGARPKTPVNSGSSGSGGGSPPTGANGAIKRAVQAAHAAAQKEQQQPPQSVEAAEQDAAYGWSAAGWLQSLEVCEVLEQARGCPGLSLGPPSYLGLPLTCP